MALGADGTFLEYHFHIFELAKKKKILNTVHTNV